VGYTLEIGGSEGCFEAEVDASGPVELFDAACRDEGAVEDLAGTETIAGSSLLGGEPVSAKKSAVVCVLESLVGSVGRDVVPPPVRRMGSCSRVSGCPAEAIDADPAVL
jgi:hypothetical protein